LEVYKYRDFYRETSILLVRNLKVRAIATGAIRASNVPKSRGQHFSGASGKVIELRQRPVGKIIANLHAISRNKAYEEMLKKTKEERQMHVNGDDLFGSDGELSDIEDCFSDTDSDF
jgi:hypothetical protein